MMHPAHMDGDKYTRKRGLVRPFLAFRQGYEYTEGGSTACSLGESAQVQVNLVVLVLYKYAAAKWPSLRHISEQFWGCSFHSKPM